MTATLATVSVAVNNDSKETLMKIEKLVSIAQQKTVSVMLDDRYPMVNCIVNEAQATLVFDNDGELYEIHIDTSLFVTPTFNVVRIRNLVDSQMYILYFYARQPLELGA